LFDLGRDFWWLFWLLLYFGWHSLFVFLAIGTLGGGISR